MQEKKLEENCVFNWLSIFVYAKQIDFFSFQADFICELVMYAFFKKQH